MGYFIVFLVVLVIAEIVEMLVRGDSSKQRLLRSVMISGFSTAVVVVVTEWMFMGLAPID